MAAGVVRRREAGRWKVAEETIAGYGTIVAECFNMSCSRWWSWTKRPRAAAMLAAAQRPDRGFDSVVIGAYERACTEISS
ncbi:hypothetical protein [Saccharopolyspora tripterygii]